MAVNRIIEENELSPIKKQSNTVLDRARKLKENPITNEKDKLSDSIYSDGINFVSYGFKLTQKKVDDILYLLNKEGMYPVKDGWLPKNTPEIVITTDKKLFAVDSNNDLLQFSIKDNKLIEIEEKDKRDLDKNSSNVLLKKYWRGLFFSPKEIDILDGVKRVSDMTRVNLRLEAKESLIKTLNSYKVFNKFNTSFETEQQSVQIAKILDAHKWDLNQDYMKVFTESSFTESSNWQFLAKVISYIASKNYTADFSNNEIEVIIDSLKIDNSFNSDDDMIMELINNAYKLKENNRELTKENITQGVEGVKKQEKDQKKLDKAKLILTQYITKYTNDNIHDAYHGNDIKAFKQLSDRQLQRFETGKDDAQRILNDYLKKEIPEYNLNLKFDDPLLAQMVAKSGMTYSEENEKKFIALVKQYYEKNKSHIKGNKPEDNKGLKGQKYLTWYILSRDSEFLNIYDVDREESAIYANKMLDKFLKNPVEADKKLFEYINKMIPLDSLEDPKIISFSNKDIISIAEKSYSGNLTKSQDEFKFAMQKYLSTPAPDKTGSNESEDDSLPLYLAYHIAKAMGDNGDNKAKSYKINTFNDSISQIRKYMKEVIGKPEPGDLEGLCKEFDINTDNVPEDKLTFSNKEIQELAKKYDTTDGFKKELRSYIRTITNKPPINTEETTVKGNLDTGDSASEIGGAA